MSSNRPLLVVSLIVVVIAGVSLALYVFRNEILDWMRLQICEECEECEVCEVCEECATDDNKDKKEDKKKDKKKDKDDEEDEEDMIPLWKMGLM